MNSDIKDNQSLFARDPNFAINRLKAIETARSTLKHMVFRSSQPASHLIDREYDRLMFRERDLRAQADGEDSAIDNCLQGSFRPDLLRHENEAEHSALAHWSTGSMAAVSSNVHNLRRKKSLTYTRLLGRASNQ